MAAAATAAGSVPMTALRLYRAVLRVNKALPDEFSILGTTYARDEFQRHKNASPEQAAVFMAAWHDYVQTMQQQISERTYKYGRKLHIADLDTLSDEQVGQLHELHGETVKPRLQ